MTHRLRLVCIIVVSFLTSAALALGQGQSAGFAGFGFSGGLAPGAYQSMGTVPALLGQTNAVTSVEISHSRDRQDSGEYGFQYGGYGYYSSGSAFWAPEYLASNDGGTAYTFAADPSPQGNAPQNGGNQGQGSNQGMSGNQNQNQNQNQGKQGQKKQQEQPQKPEYLTYTVKKKSLEEQAKSGKAAPVDFKSSPSGARVTVDGYFLGHTPMTVKIPYGKHLVSITKWGYQGFEQEIDVTAKKPVSVNPTLGKDW